MKKFASKILSICFTGILLLTAIGCKDTTEYDYTVSELKIQKRESFAPCYFREFFYQNEHCKAYFSELLNSVVWNTFIIMTVDGEEWTAIDLRMKELPYGIYDIVFETPKDMYIMKQTESGKIQVPYQKKIVIPVFVSLLGEDKYCAVV